MYDVQYDTGDKSIQCGRKTDAFKLWTMWKARGDIGFSTLVDKTFELSRSLCNYNLYLILNQVNANYYY